MLLLNRRSRVEFIVVVSFPINKLFFQIILSSVSFFVFTFLLKVILLSGHLVSSKEMHESETEKKLPPGNILKGGQSMRRGKRECVSLLFLLAFCFGLLSFCVLCFFFAVVRNSSEPQLFREFVLRPRTGCFSVSSSAFN